MKTNSRTRYAFRRDALRILVGLILMAGCFRTAEAADPSGITMEQIIKAWKKRQDHVHSLKYEWVVGAFQSKETRERISRQFKRFKLTRDGEQIRGLKYDLHYSLHLDGIRTSFELSGNRPSGLGHGALAAIESRNVYDGNDLVRLQLAYGRKEGVRFQQADILSENQDVLMDAHLLPFMLSFRMLDDRMQVAITPGALEISPEPVIVDGRRCLVLIGKRRSLWVDPDREFSIVAYNRLARDGAAIRWQLAISYVADAEHGWVPSGWERTSHSPDGELSNQSTAVVIEHTINPVIPIERFQLEIPIDALIVDERDGDDYGFWVQRAGGVRRKVPDVTANYGDMLAQIRAEEAAEVDVSFEWRWPLVVGNIVFLLVVIVLIAYCRKRTAKAS